MTISRHSETEDLAGLLGARRSELRDRIRRQGAYLNLIGAILEQPVAELEAALPLVSLGNTLVTLPDHSQAA